MRCTEVLRGCTHGSWVQALGTSRPGGLRMTLWLLACLGAYVPHQLRGLVAAVPAPVPARRPQLDARSLGAARAPPPVAGEKDISSLLQEMDQASQAASEARRRRTEAEKRVARAAEEAEAAASSKVTVFGARLDDDVAGFQNEKVLEGIALEDYERLFQAGLAAMRAGEYAVAVQHFTRATAAAPGGLTGRKGGQYAVYLAQALQAAGRKKEAVGLLKRCEGHPDQDVRKISANVLYIFQAPELKMGDEYFVQIPKVEEDDGWGRRRRAVQDKDPPPEKYSLEWYALQAESRRPVAARDEDPLPPLLLAAAVLLGTVGLLATRSGL